MKLCSSAFAIKKWVYGLQLLQNWLLKVSRFKLLLSHFGEPIYFIVNDQVMSSSEPVGSLYGIIS